MTGYSVGFIESITSTDRTYSLEVSLRAGTYPIRLISVETAGYINSSGTGSVGGLRMAFSRYQTSSISGGSLLTPTALREGAPAASSTVRHQPGTYTYSSGTYTPGASVTTTGTKLPVRNQVNSDIYPAPWSPPTEVVIAPGSTFNISIINIAGYTSLLTYFMIWYDEERTLRSS